MPEMSQADFDLLGAFKHIAAKHGGTPAGLADKMDKLVEDNADYRRKNTDLSKQIPAEGALVLSPEQKAEWEEYQKLGTPAEVKAAVEELPTVKTTLAEKERADARRAFAEAAGWKLGVVERLRDFDGATFEVREETVRDNAGKESTVKRAFITKGGEGEKPVTAEDFLKTLPEDVQGLLPAGEEAGRRGEEPRRGIEMSRQLPERPREEAPTPEDVRKATEQTADYTL